MHGTTLVTNAVIERKGAVTGMLVTAGFRDILDIGLERRYDLFDLRIGFPRRSCRAPARRDRRAGPLRRHRRAAARRRPPSGPPRAAAGEEGVEAVAVCFLHSYVNPAHERRAAVIRREEASELSVSASADVFPHHARVRALDDGDDERLRPADGRALSGRGSEHGLAELGFAAGSTS